jgi:hypothetical protein
VYLTLLELAGFYDFWRHCTLQLYRLDSLRKGVFSTHLYPRWFPYLRRRKIDRDAKATNGKRDFCDCIEACRRQPGYRNDHEPLGVIRRLCLFRWLNQAALAFLQRRSHSIGIMFTGRLIRMILSSEYTIILLELILVPLPIIVWKYCRWDICALDWRNMISKFRKNVLFSNQSKGHQSLHVHIRLLDIRIKFHTLG